LVRGEEPTVEDVLSMRVLFFNRHGFKLVSS
jgi:hypothetical protein